MANTLKIIESENRFCIGWFDTNTNDGGYLRLGEDCRVSKYATAKDKEELDEHRAVTKACCSEAPPDQLGDAYNTYYWFTPVKVRKALRVAKRALKEHRSKKDWPDWARKAQAEGWKPPRGWQP
jgi:hypothetical protein